MPRLKMNNEHIDEKLIGRCISRAEDYTSMTTRMRWRCDKCGYMWTTTPNNVVNNRTGCRACSQNVVTSDSVSIQKLKERNIIPVDTVTSSTKKVSWKCLTCDHVWVTTPTSLLDNGSGCPECARKRTGMNKVTVDDVRQRLSGRNIDIIGEYVSMTTNTAWRCNTCRYEWSATPNNILNANTRCPRCSKRYSLMENDWLDRIGVPTGPSYRQVVITIGNKRFKVDGYNSYTNTVYEFWGDYWHGNPTKYDQAKFNGVAKKTFGELLQRTNEKRAAILSAGYNLVEIWESDWVNTTAL